MTAAVIRDFMPADAPAMAQLYFESARRLGGRNYSQAQIEAWAPAPADPAAVLARASDGRVTLVAISDGTVAGYIDLEADGHVDHLYVHPGAAGWGVGARLIDEIVARARTAGMRRVHAEVSETARPLFERKGFAILHRRAFSVRGVPIHNYAMERQAL
jgi:putative acetyltransferase